MPSPRPPYSPPPRDLPPRCERSPRVRARKERGRCCVSPALVLAWERCDTATCPQVTTYRNVGSCELQRGKPSFGERAGLAHQTRRAYPVYTDPVLPPVSFTLLCMWTPPPRDPRAAVYTDPPGPSDPRLHGSRMALRTQSIRTTPLQPSDPHLSEPPCGPGPQIHPRLRGHPSSWLPSDTVHMDTPMALGPPSRQPRCGPRAPSVSPLPAARGPVCAGRPPPAPRKLLLPSSARTCGSFPFSFRLSRRGILPAAGCRTIWFCRRESF